MARQGLYPDAPKPPCVIGYEVAGVVDAVAGGVVAPRVGERVVATTRFGGQSELVVVPAANVFPLPEGWSFEEGAAFPVVYLTAHHMLVRVAAAQPGDTVLVHGARRRRTRRRGAGRMSVCAFWARLSRSTTSC